ncbi:MAG: hypothetical protein FWD75_04650 [Propionibacteriaceae bacterium]|nr:hypothetical protein [Propionibacteriaceae bacterium]
MEVRGLWGGIRAEVVVLAGSTAIRMTATVLLFLIMLDFYSSGTSVGGDASSGFYVNQAFILLGTYGTLFPCIVGAYLGGKEYDWRTRPWRLAMDGRGALWLARMVILIALAFTSVISGGLLGGLLDMLGGFGSQSAGMLVTQIAYVGAVMVFWGLVGFIISTWLRSFMWGAIIPIVWIVLGHLADFYLPSQVAAALPVWNINIVLKSLFPAQDGAMAVILPTSGSSVSSVTVFMGYLGVALVLSNLTSRRSGG